MASSTRFLVTGASGQLGGHLVRQLLRRGVAVNAWVGRRGPDIPGADCDCVDLGDPPRVRAVLVAARPSHVLHVGAMTAVGDVFADPQLGRRVNVEATQALAESAAQLEARLVYASTDMVFDGQRAPYSEDAEPCPLSRYGQSKLDGEREVLRFPSHAVLRIPLLYGRAVTPRDTTFARQLSALRHGDVLTLFDDEFRTPVSLRDASAAVLGLAETAEAGVWHLAGPERLSRLGMVRRFAAVLGVSDAHLVACSRNAVAFAEPRPADLSLLGDRFNARFPGLRPAPIGADTLGCTPDGAGAA